jgi:hypothetical protein
LIRYLLDELYTYEEDHSDALCPISHEADKLQAGEAVLAQPLRTDEARLMFEMQNVNTRIIVHEATMQALSNLCRFLPQKPNSAEFATSIPGSTPHNTTSANGSQPFTSSTPPHLTPLPRQLEGLSLAKDR